MALLTSTVDTTQGKGKPAQSDHGGPSPQVTRLDTATASEATAPTTSDEGDRG